MTMSSWSVPCGLNPFGVSTPVIEKGTPLMRKDLADRTFATENLARGRPADDADLVRAAHILRREDRAVAQRPLPDVEIIRRFTVNAGEPVLISGRDLARRNHFLADRDDPGHFAPDRFGIFDLQRAGAAPAGANAARGDAAGKNQDHVFARGWRFALRPAPSRRCRC